MTHDCSIDSLTQESTRELAILINAGVPYKDLIDGYNVPRRTMRIIAKQRHSWLPPGDIADSEEQKFRYMQRTYVNSSMLSDKARGIITNKVINYIATQVAYQLYQERGPKERRLIDKLQKIPDDTEKEIRCLMLGIDNVYTIPLEKFGRIFELLTKGLREVDAQMLIKS